MILVDTSIWIAFLRGSFGRRVGPDETSDWATCSPILQELFQGVPEGPGFRRLQSEIEGLPLLGDPVSRSTFLHAAEIYRLGRRTGITIRSATDCLIAAIAIENGVPLWHLDRDFDAIARVTALQTVSRLSRPS